ncbi:MAG: HAMP domain-containing sensor histidine kinase [Roseiflexaceae bacterium]
MRWQSVQRETNPEQSPAAPIFLRDRHTREWNIWTQIWDPAQPVDTELGCLLSGVLMQMRWVTLLALLALTFARPLQGYAGIRTWILILGFSGYNLLLDIRRHHAAHLHLFGRMPLLDLPIVALICALSPTANGPIFVLFLLVITCAATTLMLRASLIYTAIAAALMALFAPMLPLWVGSPEDIRELGAQLIVLVVVGMGTAILTQRLVLERRISQSSRVETDRLAELGRLRAEFLASISHDLRTPLTAAGAGLGMLETSANDRLSVSEQHLLDNIRRNIGRLSLLIDDLLDCNQIRAGALRLDRAPLDLRTVVADALPAVQPLIHQKGQMLAVRLPVPLPYAGDARRLGQVLVNLLCNAHQYTPPGTQITITGHLDDGKIYLTVRDDGPGIPEAAREAIFDRFYRLSAVERGSGLGLAIARGLVELHGGRLWVECTNGCGSIFSIALPRTSHEDQL